MKIPRNYIKFPKPIKQYIHLIKKKRKTKEKEFIYIVTTKSINISYLNM